MPGQHGGQATTNATDARPNSHAFGRGPHIKIRVRLPVDAIDGQVVSLRILDAAFPALPAPGSLIKVDSDRKDQRDEMYIVAFHDFTVPLDDTAVECDVYVTPHNAEAAARIPRYHRSTIVDSYAEASPYLSLTFDPVLQ